MSVAVPVKKVCVVLSRIVSTILRRQILGCVRCQRLTIVLSSFSRAHVAAEPLNLLLLLLRSARTPSPIKKRKTLLQATCVKSSGRFKAVIAHARQRIHVQHCCSTVDHPLVRFAAQLIAELGTDPDSPPV
jgi:hypothetical protein